MSLSLVQKYWKLTTSSISEWSQDLELWKGHLKEVEGKTKSSSVGL